MTRSLCLIGNSHLGCLKAAFDADGKTAPYKFFMVPGLQLDLAIDKGVAYAPDRGVARRLRQLGQGDIRVDDYDAFAIVGLRLSMSGVARVYRSFALWGHQIDQSAVRDGHYLISRPALKRTVVEFLSASPAVKIAQTFRRHTNKPIFMVPQPCGMETAKELASAETMTPRERRSWGMMRHLLDENVGQDLYEVYLESASAVAAGCGAVFVPQPDDTRTGLFTKSQYRLVGKQARDDRHANIDYGRRILDQMKAAVASS